MHLGLGIFEPNVNGVGPLEAHEGIPLHPESPIVAPHQLWIKVKN